MADDEPEKEEEECTIEDPFDTWISFRIPRCKKKEIEEKLKRRRIQNKSDVYRWCFFIGYEKEYGI